MLASDFLERFPAGAVIPDGAVLVIATDAVGFKAGYGFAPDFTLDETVAGTTAMLTIIAGAAPANPSLTNTGELVALFRWDGASDLVEDVDLVIAGNAPLSFNTIIPKTACDGPDAGGLATAYPAEANTLQDMAGDVDTIAFPRTTYKRLALEAGHEASGGAGLGGHDETSEASRSTWDSNASGAAYTAGTPGLVPATLR